MGQFKIQISKPGCGIEVFEQNDSYTEDPVNRFVSYNPSTGVVVFNAIEDSTPYTYLVNIICAGFASVIKTFTMTCAGSSPSPSAPTPPSPSAPSASCTPNYAIAWSYGPASGGDAECNDDFACDYVDGHVGAVRYISINTLGVGGRILKTNCTPFVPSDATFRVPGCNIFTIKRIDLAFAYAVVSIDNAGYITDISPC